MAALCPFTRTPFPSTLEVLCLLCAISTGLFQRVVLQSGVLPTCWDKGPGPQNPDKEAAQLVRLEDTAKYFQLCNDGNFTNMAKLKQCMERAQLFEFDLIIELYFLQFVCSELSVSLPVRSSRVAHSSRRRLP